jgi:membrane protease YdiL (CAAX protease family)
MSAGPVSSHADPETSGVRPMAAVWHTVGLLAILGLITYGGIRSHGTSTQGAPPGNLIRLYVGVMAGEWALAFYVWTGIRRRGVSLVGLIGSRWRGWSSLLGGTLLSVGFWLVWEGSARLMHFLLGSSDTANVSAMLPRTVIEVLLWCAVSCTAGFCEEIVYRGYLQRQFTAWTGNAAAAIALQAAIFGASHGYQGLKQVLIISVLGALYGVLAYWRRSLVPGIAAHAWSDVYGGWLNP